MSFWNHRAKQGLTVEKLMQVRGIGEKYRTPALFAEYRERGGPAFIPAERGEARAAMLPWQRMEGYYRFQPATDYTAAGWVRV